MDSITIICWQYRIAIRSKNDSALSLISSLEHFAGIPVSVASHSGEPVDCTLVMTEGGPTTLAFDSETKILNWTFEWERVKGQPSTIANILGQLLSLAAVNNGVFPLHAAAVLKGGQAHLLLGNSGAGKTNLSVALSRSSNIMWLGNDWVGVTIEHGLPYLVKRDHFINLRLISAAQLARFLPDSILSELKAPSKVDPLAKSRMFTPDSLKLKMGQLPVPIASAFFIDIDVAETAEGYCVPVYSSQAAEWLSREFFWPLRGLGSFVIDDLGKLLHPSVVLRPQKGWIAMMSGINSLLSNCNFYMLRASLERAVDLVLLSVEAEARSR